MSKEGFGVSALLKFRDNLEAMKKDAPAIVEQLVVGEGVYAVKQAKSIAKQEKIVDTGQYRMNWHAGDRATPAYASDTEHDGKKPRKSGTSYQIDVYNNLDYAKHLEYGFRSHFVPAKYLNPSFLSRYQKALNKARKASGLKGKAKPVGGIYVGPKGGYVRGKFVLKRAIRRTEITQQARLTRKWNGIVKEYIEGKGDPSNDG